MALPLQSFQLTDPFTTPLGWKIPISEGGLNAVAVVNNQSSTEFAVYTDLGRYLITIPARVLFVPVVIPYVATYLEFRPGTALANIVAASSTTNYVNGVLYSAKEPRPQVQPVALARDVNVGNSVAVSNATALIAGGQVDGITTIDSSAPSPDLIQIVPTHNAVSTAHGLTLESWTGTIYTAELQAYLGVIIGNGDLNIANNHNLLVSGAVTQVGGQTLAGALGVVTTPPAPVKVVVAVLTLQTILTFTPTVDGHYRANLTAVLANGTSGNAITGKVSYQDATGVNRSSNFQLISGSTSLIAAGVSSFVNGAWAGVPLYFFAKAGTAITIQFQDPTNTPNDTVSAALERLG